VGAQSIAVAENAGRRGYRWQAALAPFATPDVRAAMRAIALSLPPYFGLVAAMFLLVNVSYPLVLVLAVPAGGFLIRIFLVMHDCAHGSFFPWRAANRWVGRGFALLTFQSFRNWQYYHLAHHRTGSDLTAEGIGDLEMLTVEQFNAASRAKRLTYRLTHNPLVVLGLGGLWNNLIEPRFIFRSAPRSVRRGRLATDLALAVVLVAAGLLLGWWQLFVVMFPVYWVAAIIGVWLFWVQHRFEGAYWDVPPDWNFEDAALAGSSHLELPGILRFFTLNAGNHHVHHLNPRIPSYKLRHANDSNEFLRRIEPIHFRDGLRALRLSLYDSQARRLVTFADARRLRTAQPQ
jgi:omega-6 fatty acid desaturase (delta-12 desaturase)